MLAGIVLAILAVAVVLIARRLTTPPPVADRVVEVMLIVDLPSFKRNGDSGSLTLVLSGAVWQGGLHAGETWDRISDRIEYLAKSYKADVYFDMVGTGSAVADDLASRGLTVRRIHHVRNEADWPQGFVLPPGYTLSRTPRWA